VPGVTQGAGPDIVEQSTTMFGRLDVQPSDRQALTLEALAFPAATTSAGLSPRREQPATANNRSSDVFVGLTDRFVFADASVLTMKGGVVMHDTTITPNGSGIAYLSPQGWRGNWFASVDRRAIRYTVTMNWDRTIPAPFGTHALTMGSSVTPRRLSGTVFENPVVVENSDGQTVRSIDFGPGSTIRARDARISGWLRDAWRASDRAELDLGVRVDENLAIGGMVPSGRAGLRYALDKTGLTVLKAGVGRFVGVIPLAVQAFAGYPARIDRAIDAVGGAFRKIRLQPAIGDLRLPSAFATSILIERQLAPSLDAQMGVTRRHSTHLATLDVPADGGPMPVQSAGVSSYRELQISVRRTWRDDQQLFVSYVRSATFGEVNDFATLFQTLDAPVLRPGGMARTPTDARNRWIAWGTFNLPRRVVVSPVLEIHSGFPFSAYDQRYDYYGQPNSRQFPTFMAMDIVAYKTLTVRRRTADVGFQLFNATNHFNPRDVYSVVEAPGYGGFTNSVGSILRGFMLLKW
jgi:hypothetical protein